MDKKYTKLAAESPLDFIEQVLANHPQPNWTYNVTQQHYHDSLQFLGPKLLTGQETDNLVFWSLLHVIHRPVWPF